MLTLLCAGLYGAGLSVVPVVDRDEARFAQATYQMLESGDYWRIAFQNEPRTKKPHGIHWLQAVSVTALSTPEAKEIWAYRLASAIGAWLAVLLAHALMRDLFGRREAFVGGVLLATTPLLIAEAHIATADAALLAGIVAAHWALARAYLAGKGGPPAGTGMAILFWGALIASALIKGPIGPFVTGMTAATLVVIDRRAGWLAALRPVTGLIAFVVVLGWWWWQASLGNDGSFATAALQEDFIPKLFSGQESHGAPPGTHAVIALLALGPAIPFVLFGLVHAFAHRRESAMRFCLAWLVPAWIVFELVATKLPHYTLPLYPALVAIGVAAIGGGALSGRAGRIALIGWSIFSACISITIITFAASGGNGIDLPWDHFAGLAGINLVTCFGIAFLAWRGRVRRVAYLAAGATAAMAITALTVAAPRLDALWISERIAAAVAEHHEPGTPFGSVGYTEPSLVFLMGTDTALMWSGAGGKFAAAEPSAIIAVDEADRAAFEESAAQSGAKQTARVSIDGFHYSVGRWTRIWLYMP